MPTYLMHLYSRTKWVLEPAKVWSQLTILHCWVLARAGCTSKVPIHYVNHFIAHFVKTIVLHFTEKEASRFCVKKTFTKYDKYAVLPIDFVGMPAVFKLRPWNCVDQTTLIPPFICGVSYQICTVNGVKSFLKKPSYSKNFIHGFPRDICITFMILNY